jgi:hypothetical protein
MRLVRNGHQVPDASVLHAIQAGIQLQLSKGYTVNQHLAGCCNLVQCERV